LNRNGPARSCCGDGAACRICRDRTCQRNRCGSSRCRGRNLKSDRCNLTAWDRRVINAVEDAIATTAVAEAGHALSRSARGRTHIRGHPRDVRRWITYRPLQTRRNGAAGVCQGYVQRYASARIRCSGTQCKCCLLGHRHMRAKDKTDNQNHKT